MWRQDFGSVQGIVTESNSNVYNTVNTEDDNTFGLELDKRRMDILIDGPPHDGDICQR